MAEFPPRWASKTTIKREVDDNIAVRVVDIVIMKLDEDGEWVVAPADNPTIDDVWFLVWVDDDYDHIGFWIYDGDKTLYTIEYADDVQDDYGYYGPESKLVLCGRHQDMSHCVFSAIKRVIRETANG